MSYRISQREAEGFFQNLRQASIEILQYYKLPDNPGHKRRPWKDGRPQGILEHFTAGVNWKTSADWLNGQANQDSSCHFLVLDRRLGEIDDIVSRYPVLDELPVTAIMLSDLSSGTWHGGWANPYTVGIENRNAGRLRFRDGKYYWWPKGYTAEFPPALGKQPVEIDGFWWEPFNSNQILANIIIGQHLHCMYQSAGGLNPSWVLPHSATSINKSDTGRAFPFHDVRTAIFEQKDPTHLPWLGRYDIDPIYMDDYEEEVTQEFLREMDERQGPRVGTDENLLITWRTETGPWEENIPAIRLALHLLGYWIPPTVPQEMDPLTSLAVWQFQKSVEHLETDGVPGPKTQAALKQRLKDFQLEVDHVAP
jgi:N-acetyl-anhydromuramyl-L-alanine amidase AmpD